MRDETVHQNILAYLNVCSKNGSLAHAYAFIGANNIGRMRTLEVFLKEFVGSGNNAARHPDIRLIAPEKDIITIDAMRSARSWLSLTSISSDKKVLIVKDAHAMNEEAQNAFLKILEEPAGNTYIFLIINHKDQVLQTIYSRLSPIYFSGSPAESGESDSSLAEKIRRQTDISERMRIWMREKMSKDRIHSWLRESVPVFRRHIIETRSEQSAQAMRDLLNRLSHPKSQNWQMVAENFIISL